MATRLFIDKGYRRTQMADVTQAMGLSPGAVYRYVESKEALFDLIVRAGAAPEQALANLKLPVATPSPEPRSDSYVRLCIARVASRALSRRSVANRLAVRSKRWKPSCGSFIRESRGITQE